MTLALHPADGKDDLDNYCELLRKKGVVTDIEFSPNIRDRKIDIWMSMQVARPFGNEQLRPGYSDAGQAAREAYLEVFMVDKLKLDLKAMRKAGARRIEVHERAVSSSMDVNLFKATYLSELPWRDDWVQRAAWF